MEYWVQYWAKKIGILGVCVTILSSLLFQVGPLSSLMRGLIVGLVLFLAVSFIGGLVAQAVLRMAVAEEMRRDAEKKATAEKAEQEAEGQTRSIHGRRGLKKTESPAAEETPAA